MKAPSVGDVLERVVLAAHHIVPSADLVSVTLRSPDQTFHTPVETDSMATELDKLQYDTGEGPCVAAARNPGPAHVYCDDLAAEPSWPTFGPTAAERGIHAVLALALLPDARPDPPAWVDAAAPRERQASGGEPWWCGPAEGG